MIQLPGLQMTFLCTMSHRATLERMSLGLFSIGLRELGTCAIPVCPNFSRDTSHQGHTQVCRAVA